MMGHIFPKEHAPRHAVLEDADVFDMRLIRESVHRLSLSTTDLTLETSTGREINTAYLSHAAYTFNALIDFPIAIASHSPGAVE